MFNQPGREWEAHNISKNADSYVAKTQKALSLVQLALSVFVFVRKIRGKK